MQAQSVDEVLALLQAQGYVGSRRLATSVHLALALQRPLFLEGEPGVGKTELAKVLARALGAPLIRLQCYEGLDVSQAAYEWNVPRQMMEIRLAEVASRLAPPDGGAGGQHPTPTPGRDSVAERDVWARSLYRRELLIERPLLQALTQPVRPVLLIDELDRADEPFDAYLLELLAENQITIPEYGVVRAEHPPITFITSNRTREVHDALKRRCLYQWVGFPDEEQELAILRAKAPQAGESLSRQVVAFVQRMRLLDLFKAPGVAETIDWTNALVALDAMRLDPDSVHDTMGVLLKYQDDVARLQGAEVGRLIDELKALAIIDGD